MRRKTHEEFIREVSDLVGKEYSVLETYKTNKTKILFKHNICNYKYEVAPHHFLQGKRCPYCANKNRNKERTRSTEKFKKDIFNLVGNEYEVLGKYINNKTKILMKHNICGNKFEMRPNDFQQGKRCPKCSGNIKKTQDQFVQEVFDLVGNKYTVLGKYINIKTKILMIHNECGYKYKVRPIYFLRGNRCPKCALNKSISKGAQTIKKFLDDKYHIKYNMEVSFKDLKYKQPLRFDFQIFLKDGSFILLEYNGSQHYKAYGYITEEKLLLNQKRDNIKIDYCKRHFIPLYIIKYTENIEERLQEILEGRV